VKSTAIGRPQNHGERTTRRALLVVDQVMKEERAAGFGREGGLHELLPYLTLN